MKPKSSDEGSQRNVKELASKMGLDRYALTHFNNEIHTRLDHPEVFADIITNDKKMVSIFKYMEHIAPTSEPVLITGETGVGKELVARIIHK